MRLCIFPWNIETCIDISNDKLLENELLSIVNDLDQQWQNAMSDTVNDEQLPWLHDHSYCLKDIGTVNVVDYACQERIVE